MLSRIGWITSFTDSVNDILSHEPKMRSIRNSGGNLRKKSGNLMNYAKPEITLLANVAGAIQNPSDKSEQEIAECDPLSPYLQSITAYTADE